MTALRDALRKAERAQEEARQQASPEPLALEPLAGPGQVAGESRAVDPAPSEPVADGLDLAPVEPGRGANEREASASNALPDPKPERSWQPNPRLPFYVVLSALALAAAGAASHFWLQLRTPLPAAHFAPPRAAPSPSSAPPSPAAAASLLATTEQALASLARAEAGERTPDPPPAPPPDRKPRAAAPSAGSGAIVVPRPAGGSETARPAADPHRLKEIPARPEPAAALASLLGSEHARDGRWSEAREAFAIAASEDPANPDLAFNLAVSYDRLQQRREALEHYQHALRLRQGRPASFPADAARERMRYLARSGERR